MASPSNLATTEGYISFAAPNTGKPSQTWYKVVGDLSSSTSPPLITLHGGPGAGHEYLLSLTDLYTQHGIPIIFYDQIGCGRSTHFPERMGDAQFWTFELFYQELDNLIDHFQLRERGYHVLGHSWGGMFGGGWASLKPRGLKKLVISGGPASVPLCVKGVNELLAQLPEDVRKTLEDCEERGDYESAEYEAAAGVFYKRHVCRIDPMPEEVQVAFRNLKEDPTSYLTIQGPSEFRVTGTFKHWEGHTQAHNIEAETLLINGRYDEVTDLSIWPWFKAIPKVKWVTLENAAHITHYEERERHMQIVGAFLEG